MSQRSGDTGLRDSEYVFNNDIQPRSIDSVYLENAVVQWIRVSRHPNVITDSKAWTRISRHRVDPLVRVQLTRRWSLCDSEYIVDLHVETDLVDRESIVKLPLLLEFVVWELRKVTDHEVSQVWWWSQNVSPSIHISVPAVSPEELCLTTEPRCYFLADWLYIWISDHCLLSSCVKQKYGFISHEFRADRIDKIIREQLQRYRTSSTSLSNARSVFNYDVVVCRFGLLPWWWKFHCSPDAVALAITTVLYPTTQSASTAEAGLILHRFVPGTWMMLLILIEDFTWVIDWVEIWAVALRCFEWRELAQCSQCFG